MPVSVHGVHAVHVCLRTVALTILQGVRENLTRERNEVMASERQVADELLAGPMLP
jgi:hypothetical protein